MDIAITVIIAFIVASVVAYAVIRNLRDGHRADSLHAQIVTLKEEHRTHIEGVKKQIDAERQISENNKEEACRHIRTIQSLEKAQLPIVSAPEGQPAEFWKQQAAEWRKKWEDERGGSSARDQVEKQLRAELDARFPIVVPVCFGAQDFPKKQSKTQGLMLSNDGPSVAYDVRILPFMIGAWNTWFGSLSRLEPSHKVPVQLSMEKGGHLYANLAENLSEFQSIAGTIGEAVPFTIAYRDSSNHWFKSFCELKLDPLSPGAVKATFLRRDISPFEEVVL